ncbi:MAG: protein-L-isoaspartate(D-aspartate) O-methyltransferase [Patescibacteria group bacterium]
MQEKLVRELIGQGVLHTDPVIAAFNSIRRNDFVHEELQANAYEDAPLPIGYNQTISQPSTVAIMLELLQVQPGDRILEVGCGSGWLTGLLAALAGTTGQVYAIDVLPELVDLTKEHLQPYHLKNVDVRWGNGWQGLPRHAPYNRIIVSAAAPSVPSALTAQLVRGGRLVIPIGGDLQDLVVVTKPDNGPLHEEHHPGFQFVPLVSHDHHL